MNYLKVITHDTTFHADEVLAVAMLKKAGFEIELVRTRNTTVLEEALADPQIAVLDVGGVYDPGMLNFDHHQDMSLQSAAGLVYMHFKDLICPSEAQPFLDNFVAGIDAMDTNRDNIFATWDLMPSGFRNTSGLIGGFNREVTDPAQQLIQFEHALSFAGNILDNEIYSALKKARSEAAYSERLVLPNNVAVFEEYSAIWKNKKEHLFAVMPHANGWQINSRDTTLGQIPESIAECEGFVFRHKSGFMAVVKDREVAVSFAENM